EQTAFEESDSGYESRITLEHDTSISARLGAYELGEWQFTVIPDAAPVIAFAEPPAADENRAVHFAYTASDDYGVACVVAEIVPVNVATQAAADPKPLMVAMAPPANAKEIAQLISRDLTAHVY